MSKFQTGFNELVLPYEKKFRKVIVPEEKIQKIKLFTKQLISAKKNEDHHMRDPFQEEKRWFTGISGEAACEQLLDLEIIDWSIGASSKFHISDLKNEGYDLGVKTVEWGKFHVIFKVSRSPQIIVFKISDTEFRICGIADIQCLNSNQDLNLILSPYLRSRGSKTAFTGYEELKHISCLDDLSPYKS